MVYETRISGTNLPEITLTAVNTINLGMSFNNSKEEGINATYPISVTNTGIVTPTLSLSGDLFLGADQKLIDWKTKSRNITPNTMKDIWALIKNYKYIYNITPFKLADDNTISKKDFETSNSFYGKIKSISISPQSQYVGDYVGDIVSYTITFDLTGI